MTLSERMKTPQDDKSDLIWKIQSYFSKLSKGQKIIAEYIVIHYEKAAFMTAAKLGETVGVSESTVVRFADAMGFSGYPELQRTLQEVVKNKLTTVQRIEMADDLKGDSAILKKILKADMENIRHTLEETDSKAFENTLSTIEQARKIYIVATRSTGAIAQYLHFYLSILFENVVLINYGLSDMYEQLVKATSKDLVIGLSFPRYSKKTFTLMSYARQKGCGIVAITDSRLSPIAGIADEVLLSQSSMASFVDSLVAPLSIINAIIVALGMRQRENTKDTLDHLESLWAAYDIYENE